MRFPTAVVFKLDVMKDRIFTPLENGGTTRC